MWSNISRLSVTEPGVELLPGSHRKTEHPIGPQGIEPRSVVPETTVLSVELQAHFSARYTVSSMETYCARMVVAAATGGECYPNSNGIKARL